MHTFPSEVSSRMKRELANRKPDLLLYIDNPYINELIEALIEIFAEEVADIRNNYVNSDDIKRRI